MFKIGEESETIEFKATTYELREAVASVCGMLNKYKKRLSGRGLH